MINVASIVHGAYGDYYEQLLCLKHYKSAHPTKRLFIFFSSAHRYETFLDADLSFADEVGLATNINDYQIDVFFQFQAHDEELRAEILNNLPEETLKKIDLKENKLPHTYLRKIIANHQLPTIELNAKGKHHLEEIFKENNLNEDLFNGITIGFLWRYRQNSAIRSWRQRPADELVEKYSAVFNTLIKQLNCHVMICGMKVETTDSNRTRVDAKFPTYGLKLSPGHATHMQGLSWLLEMEILARCNVILCHPSGFSEAIYLRNRKGIMVDPPYHYLAKLIKHRMPFFGFNRLMEKLRCFIQPHSEQSIIRLLRRELKAQKKI